MGTAEILYVDDESDILDLALSFFEDENIPLDTCSNIESAIALVKKNTYKVIITDAKMPGGTGFDLIRFLREDLLFQGKIILATGSLQRSTEKAGYDFVIQKPINFAEMIEKVKEIL
jgi:two-component system response regulator PilR (NtrC family)